MLGLGWFPDQSGGSNRYFRDLLEHLRSRGEDVSAVVVGPAAEGADDVAVAVTGGARLLTRLRAFWSAADDLASASDLVDVHFALYGFAPVVVGRLRQLPLVVHFHGPWAEEAALAARKRRSAMLIRRAIERSVYHRADATIALSEAFKRTLVERYGVSPWLVEVVPPGVDLERFTPGNRSKARDQFELSEEEWVVCAARRLVPRMGLHVLLQAWALLQSPGILLIAGDGPERQSLEQQAARLGVRDSVRFLGQVSDESLVSLYRSADVCVVPSIALEGFGLVVLEALACGTPVVASNVGGLPSALAKLEPQTIVPAGNAQALADRLRRPLPDGTQCRSIAEGFSWDRCVERHEHIYRQAVAGRPRLRRLRVVFVDHTARLSGAELAMSRLLPLLDVDAHVILGEEGPLVARLERAGVSVEVLTLPQTTRGLNRSQIETTTLASRRATDTLVYAGRLSLRLRHLGPDLVHTNSLKSALYGGLAARLAGIPVVSHAHDRLADDYMPATAARLTRVAYSRLARAVIAPSQAVAETVGCPVHVIPWGAPITHLPMVSPHPFTVGLVGRIAQWKGQAVFIEAFARAFPDGDEKAIIVGAPLFGADEDAYMEQLHELALTLDGRLTFSGFVDDLDAELAGLDVLVHASIVPEPFGQVVLEGMAAGLPVIATKEGGPGELIQDGVNGLLYAAGDPTALAAHLARLAHDPELRQSLGSAAQRTAAAIPPELTAQQIRRVYAEVLAQRPINAGKRPEAQYQSVI